MRTIPLAVAALVLAALAGGPAAAAELKNEEQKTFYALGLAIGENLGSFSLSEAELKLVSAGIVDSVLHKKPEVDFHTYGPKIQDLQRARLTAAAVGEKKAGQAFVAKAAAEKGASKTAGGAIVSTIKPGTGASPTATDKVKVHYHGTLVDGTVFDSSVQRGEPVTFPLNGVIPCWTEGVQQMKVGGKYRLVCPSELAYGDRGAPPRIKPGATLMFEVELLDIAK
ncbi:MAG: FKBP-type peptidyl-prolyl cis-trans isomerase [Candidatus Rokubacteria bacterium]|nr:FKBP-type peptidyl-prolyl cis-trans isomerase [Candidatus Rokubacteria bacterium]